MLCMVGAFKKCLNDVPGAGVVKADSEQSIGV